MTSFIGGSFIDSCQRSLAFPFEFDMKDRLSHEATEGPELYHQA